MAQFEITTFEDPYYEMEVDLEGATYRFVFDYSVRERAFYFSLYDLEGLPLISGLKVRNNVTLIGTSQKEGLPPGELVAYTPGPYDDAPELEELGPDKRVTLLYLSSDEYARTT